MEKWAMLPKVKEYEYLEGSFTFDEIAVNTNLDKELYGVLHTVLGEILCHDGKYNLELQESELGEEEYKIQITRSGIVIQYGSLKGLFYGAITLKHLRKQFGVSIPCMKLRDYPDVPVRGILYDISRNKVPKLETLYLLVDMMADLKYNQLQLYVEGLSFEYESFRSYLKEDSYIRKSEIVSLKEYCKKRFIELIPNQNTLGHMTDWLSIDEFRRLARNAEGEMAFGKMQRPGTLDPENRGSEEFVECLTNEMLPQFESQYYNVNLDETFGITEHGLYQKWILKMYDICKKHGKKMMMWSDMVISFADGIDALPEDITFLDWGYEDHYPFDTECQELKKRNLDFYLCPGTSSWCSIAGRTDNMIQNVDKAIDCAHRYGAKGILMTDWGDAGHWQAFPISWPGFAYAAARTWNKEAVSLKELTDYLNDFIFEDSNGQMGELSLMMGRICRFDDFRLLNGSLFHHQLVMGLCSKEEFEDYVQYLRNWMIPYAKRFYEDGGKELIEQIECGKAFDYEGIKKYIDSMKVMVRQSDMKRKDSLWTKSEYEQSLLLLELAAEIRLYIESQSLLQREERLEKLAGLKQLVQESKELFMKNWMNRNKVGELEKSEQMFEQIMRQIAQSEEK
ncbi:family 20 glycosylhydrolase [Anaerocolumna xylanovorans]|uniref:Glycosyl hydrolase family 20, domain 2 n=1 Tax=Anaerocolumna xylanovorans DSM 12503 TaxID=1121345 RepID=A0A1M7XYK2_9FIRM|nr:family 20 glycosylhydrolase [Anaerocolumna xylanovorans]SHO43903.1 Glycosyl hydrolase family 20, domain 2 [Anaerocolumna xylanovorans DSM 12503]